MKTYVCFCVMENIYAKYFVYAASKKKAKKIFQKQYSKFKLFKIKKIKKLTEAAIIDGSRKV